MLSSWNCQFAELAASSYDRSTKTPRHVDAETAMGCTHLVTADDVRVAGELGALLDKEFFAQDLPKFPPNVDTASELISEAI
jgi:hypothetical protein